MHRVLKPGGEALIIDLRKDASLHDIADEVRNMHLSAWNALVTRFIFRHGLLRAAYTADQLADMARKSTFGGGDVTPRGIGFELRLTKGR
jgi:ubiquinone/menaquinone biosynthesis C-methylase UbiE